MAVPFFWGLGSGSYNRPENASSIFGFRVDQSGFFIHTAALGGGGAGVYK
jgi:hypothetical protein